MTRALVLGLDASPRRIGWALVDYEDATIVELGVEFTPAGDDLRNRRRAVREIAKTARRIGDVFAVFVEDAYAGPNRAVTVQHAGTVGNVEAFALERWPRILVARLASSTWRSSIGVSAKGKADVVLWAQNKTGRAMWTQDEADALGIATAGQLLVWDEGGVASGAKVTLPNPSPLGKEADR